MNTATSTQTAAHEFTTTGCRYQWRADHETTACQAAFERFSAEVPGNRKDRARYEALTEWDQAVVRAIRVRLYDGSRTIARCWKDALDAVEA
jgi:hypothetical protein